MRMLDGIERLRASLDYHLSRHNVLTSNLAQIDTPGFRARDLERVPSFKAALNVEMRETHEGHLASTRHPHGSRLIQDAPRDVGLDDNGVSLDREAVKIAANQLRYDTIAGLTSGALSGLAWAVNDGKNV